MNAPPEVAAAAAAVRDGMTLPAAWYTAAGHFERELDDVFGQAWQYVATTDELAAAGDYVTATVGRVPVVVTRDSGGALHALVNVCRHRCHEVAAGRGNRMTLQCPYHGWTYGLDGRLRTAPRAEAEAAFDPAELGLLRARVDVWEPFVFVALGDEMRPLREALGRIPELMTAYGFDLAALERRKVIRYELEANWKVYVENSLECYHCPVAHPALTKTVEMRPDVYRLEADQWVMAHESRLRDAARAEGRAGPLLEQRTGVPEFQFYYVWPSFMLAPSPGRLWLGTFEPLDAHRTLVTTEFYFEPGLAEHRVEESAAFSDQVLREDRALVESVQRGLRSGQLPHGRLLPQSERLLRHFQELVLEAARR